MNQKLLSEFRNVNAKERIVIDYTQVKNLDRLRDIMGDFPTGVSNYYWLYDYSVHTPPFPHRLVTVDDFYEEEWQPVSGEEVDVLSHVWKKGRYIGTLDGVYYIMNGDIFHSGTQIRKHIPTISIEEAEKWMKENGREVKIKN